MENASIIHSFKTIENNRKVHITVGMEHDVYLQELLDTFRSYLVSSGFDYVDEIRAISYARRSAEGEEIVHSSNWMDERPVYDEYIEAGDNSLEEQMTKETLE